jgi:hypothetical protein
MDRNERNCRTPISGDTTHPAATPRARPAGLPRDPTSPPAPPPSAVPLLLRDPTCLVRCSRREALILLAGIALLATPAVAASGDPAGEDDRRRRLAARFAADPRLDQTIRLTDWSEPLEDLLARLSAKTGVQLAFEGREVGDQRVNVVLKDQPLRRVLLLLADTLDLYWRRERKDGAYRYALFQDLRSRMAEEAVSARARERFEEGIRRMVDSLKLTPQQIAELRPKNRSWADHLENQPSRRLAIELVGRLAPAHLDRALQTGRLEIPLASLSPGDQALVLRFVQEHNQWRAKKNLERGWPPDSHIIGDMTRPGGQVSLSVLGGVPVGPDSVLDVGAEAADGKGSTWGVVPGFTDPELRSIQEELRPPRFENDPRETPVGGWPRLTVAWKERPKRWETVLRELVKAADLQLVSDAYLYYWWEQNEALADVVDCRDRPLPELLDLAAVPFFRVWRRDGDVYLFRSWRWLLEKRQNVPERDLRRWHGHLKASGRMVLEDLVEMASLTGPQPGMVYHTGLPTAGATRHREVLHFYGALSSLQRARLQTTGLRVGEVSPPQVEILRAWKPSAEAGPDSLLRLRREEEAVVFQIAMEGSAPQEERVPLESGHAPTGP